MSSRSARELPPMLFGGDALRSVPTWQARLKRLAETPSRALTAREARAEENGKLMERLLGIAEDLAPRFGLRYASIEAERDGVTRHYGICYADGVIRIRLRHAVSDRPLKESSLVDTLCHELAHLRHFDHGERFRRLHVRILDEARRLGFYRPGPQHAPRQLHLFGDRT